MTQETQIIISDLMFNSQLDIKVLKTQDKLLEMRREHLRSALEMIRGKIATAVQEAQGPDHMGNRRSAENLAYFLEDFVLTYASRVRDIHEELRELEWMHTNLHALIVEAASK